MVKRSPPGIFDEYDLKIEHSENVRKNCELIADGAGLAGRDFMAASLCGLYHDLGRFEQALRFGTMDDRITGSHAALSVGVFINEAPKDGLTENEIRVISAAIGNHNLFRLRSDLEEDELPLAKLVRDADKLDIFRYVIDVLEQRELRKFSFVQFDNIGGFRRELIEAVLNRENLECSRVMTSSDRLLMELSLVFDLNYPASFRLALDLGFVEKLTGGHKELDGVRESTLEFMRDGAGI